MTVSNIIVGICCAVAASGIIWAAINEFRPESKDEANEDSEEDK